MFYKIRIQSAAGFSLSGVLVGFFVAAAVLVGVSIQITRILEKEKRVEQKAFVENLMLENLQATQNGRVMDILRQQMKECLIRGVDCARFEQYSIVGLEAFNKDYDLRGVEYNAGSAPCAAQCPIQRFMRYRFVSCEQNKLAFKSCPRDLLLEAEVRLATASVGLAPLNRKIEITITEKFLKNKLDFSMSENCLESSRITSIDTSQGTVSCNVDLKKNPPPRALTACMSSSTSNAPNIYKGVSDYGSSDPCGEVPLAVVNSDSIPADQLNAFGMGELGGFAYKKASKLQKNILKVDARCSKNPTCGGVCLAGQYGGIALCAGNRAPGSACPDCCLPSGHVLNSNTDVPGNLARSEVKCGTSCPSRQAYGGSRANSRCCSGREKFVNGRFFKRCKQHCSWCGKNGGCNYSNYQLVCE